MAIKYLDAKRLRVLFSNGGKWVIKHEELLNELNVYPVPDGDTGSNMAMTLNSMITDIEGKTNEKTSMKDFIDTVEEAVLMGARGNSGTILSQVITGFLKGIGEKTKLLSADVAQALSSAKETAYNAVSEPVEGTMLTVIRRISEKANECASKIDDLVIFLKEIMKKTGLTKEEIAYMGDDLNDVLIMKQVGLSGAPKDAVNEVIQIADFISEKNGGSGAVREFVEHILKKDGKWQTFLENVK